MIKKILISSLTLLAMGSMHAGADNLLEKKNADNEQTATEQTESTKHRLTIGGYGEAVASRMFYSNNYKRYTNADLYKDDKGFVSRYSSTATASLPF